MPYSYSYFSAFKAAYLFLIISANSDLALASLVSILSMLSNYSIFAV